MTEQRKMFEEWWLGGAYGNRPCDRFEDKGVSEDEVFESWQACLAAQPAPQRVAVPDAELVLQLLDTQQWRLSRSATLSYFTDEANKRDAWFVERTYHPFADKDGMRSWFGPTAIEAFKTAHAAMGMPMPAAPQPDGVGDVVTLEDCRALPEPEIRVHDKATWRAVKPNDGPVYGLLCALLAKGV